jgi:transposase
MLTRMTEQDWVVALEAFRAARSRRGDEGRDDRRFLEALHSFAVHNVTWRALPAEFGNWNSVWKRFWRLSRTGTFEAFFQALAGLSRTAHLVASRADVRQHHHPCACLGGRGKGGQQGQALGRSRGGFGTKIHLKCDRDGLPLDFHLTGGEASDSRQFETLLDIGPDVTPRAVMADKGSDAQANRDTARQRGICPVIPYRSNAKDRPRFFPKRLYRRRARIEQAIGKLKRFKRIALRCEKTAENYAALIAFVCGLICVKSVHMA